MSDENDFDQLAQLAHEGGAEQTLEFLEQRFRDDQNFFKLFEVLKMRCRYALGLSLTYGHQPDDLTEAQQRQLEDGLLNACQEVGKLLIANGQLQEGWMYLQPVADREWVAETIRAIPINDENVDTVIEIAVTQGAAPAYGYGLLMKHYGTCNAITTFDTQAMRFDKQTQQTMAAQLLRHLYAELCTNLKHVVQQEGKTITDGLNLAEILRQHAWLMNGGAHHIDTTHLASMMRIARVVDQQADLQKALELADYGRQLHDDFQYPSPPPFEATYLDHKLFFAALLGQNVDEAVKHFESKCETVDTSQFGPVAYEVLVDLLVRSGRNEKAIDVLTANVLGQHEPIGIAPNVFEIAKSESQLAKVRDFFHSQNDLLGFALSILKS